MKKKQRLTMKQLVDNAQKVLKGKLITGNNGMFDAALKRAVHVKQRGSK